MAMKWSVRRPVMKKEGKRWVIDKFISKPRVNPHSLRAVLTKGSYSALICQGTQESFLKYNRLAEQGLY